MFYVYILKSLKNKDLYIGYSENLKERLKSHNEGKVWSTKAYRPWELVFYEAYKHKEDAYKREKTIKRNHKIKDYLRDQLKFSLM